MLNCFTGTSEHGAKRFRFENNFGKFCVIKIGSCFFFFFFWYFTAAPHLDECHPPSPVGGGHTIRSTPARAAVAQSTFGTAAAWAARQSDTIFLSIFITAVSYTCRRTGRARIMSSVVSSPQRGPGKRRHATTI